MGFAYSTPNRRAALRLRAVADVMAEGLMRLGDDRRGKYHRIQFQITQDNGCGEVAGAGLGIPFLESQLADILATALQRTGCQITHIVTRDGPR